MYAAYPSLLLLLFLGDCANCLKVNLPIISKETLSQTGQSFRKFALSKSSQIDKHSESYMDQAKGLVTTAALVASLSFPANAVSGGGLDFANLDITGQDFSGNSYKGKDFTQVIAKGTSFKKSNLQGCRFYKAFLVSSGIEWSHHA